MNIEAVDLFVAARLKRSREERQVDGLIQLLSRIVSDLESGRAVEMDFDIQVDEHTNVDCINLKLQTFHFKGVQDDSNRGATVHHTDSSKPMLDQGDRGREGRGQEHNPDGTSEGEPTQES
jgi:hypothetical protein